MIDWNAPLETTPDERNPAPVPCVVVRTERRQHIVHFGGAWQSADGYQAGNTEWWYPSHENGASNDWLPVLRNVQP